MQDEQAKPVKFINPINGEPVDEIIKEREAKARGYFDMQFLLKYLEDDNEFVKYFIIDGKKIIVDIEKPYLQYKKPTQINHERVLNTDEFTGGEAKKNSPHIPYVPPADQCCGIDTCEACGS